MTKHKHTFKIDDLLQEYGSDIKMGELTAALSEKLGIDLDKCVLTCSFGDFTEEEEETISEDEVKKNFCGLKREGGDPSIVMILLTDLGEIFHVVSELDSVLEVETEGKVIAAIINHTRWDYSDVSPFRLNWIYGENRTSRVEPYTNIRFGLDSILKMPFAFHKTMAGKANSFERDLIDLIKEEVKK